MDREWIWWIERRIVLLINYAKLIYCKLRFIFEILILLPIHLIYDRERRKEIDPVDWKENCYFKYEPEFTVYQYGIIN